MSQMRPTWEEAERRRDYVVEWSLKKRSVEQIMRGLRPGVSKGVITADRKARARQLEGKKLFNGNAPPLPDPPPYDWLAVPPPKVERSYEINSALPRMQGFLEYLQDSNALARLPHNIEEAIDAGDAAWYLKFQITGQEIVRTVNRMLQVIESREAFTEAKQPAARYDLTRDVVVPSVQEQHMPQHGAGVMPGRIFRDMLGAWFAGIEIDEEFIQETARKERAVTGRVRRAAREFAAVMEGISR